MPVVITRGPAPLPKSTARYVLGNRYANFIRAQFKGDKEIIRQLIRVRAIANRWKVDKYWIGVKILANGRCQLLVSLKDFESFGAKAVACPTNALMLEMKKMIRPAYTVSRTPFYRARCVCNPCLLRIRVLKRLGFYLP
jgi:hypothetical protein